MAQKKKLPPIGVYKELLSMAKAKRLSFDDVCVSCGIKPLTVRAWLSREPKAFAIRDAVQKAIEKAKCTS